MMMAGAAALPAWASVITEVQIIAEYGLTSAYNATSQFQTYTGDPLKVSTVLVKTDGGNFVFTKESTQVNFKLGLDMSSGGLAKGYFQNTGSWTCTVMKPDATPVIQLGGGLVWFLEEEEPGQTLRGVGVVGVTTSIIDPGYFGPGVTWASTDGKSAMKTVSTQLTIDPADYARDFGAKSVTLTLYADSTEAPEPMTLALLALGGLGLRRLRQRSGR